MMGTVEQERLRQRQWEDGFRKRYPTHPALLLINGVSKLDVDGARAIEQLHVPFAGEYAKLIHKARELAHARTGKDFSGIVVMATRAALRAAPDNWQSVEIFRLGACVDAALWAVLAQDDLKPVEYYALTRAVAVSIPEIKEPGGLPEKEEVVTTEVKLKEEVPTEEATEETPQPTSVGGEFIAEAQKWVDANPSLYATFQKEKMGYVGGAFSYTCEKLIKDAGVADQVGRGQRTLAAFAVVAKKVVYGSDNLPKIAAAWWADRTIIQPEVKIENSKVAAY